METVTEKLSNGNEITYKVIGGTAFHIDTPDRVVDILTAAIQARRQYRLRLFLGDPTTGRDWGKEDYCSIGYIGRSTGRIKIPLCVYNQRSMGGPALLDDKIVKIVDVQSKRVLYQHPAYHQPTYTVGKPPEKIGNVTMEEYQAGVYADGENVANFKTERQANHWIAFMRGERMRK